MSNSWGFIDTAGKVVIECLYEQEGSEFAGKLSVGTGK